MFEILPQPLFLVSLHPRGLGSTESVGLSLGVSDGIWPPSRGQEAARVSRELPGVVVFYHFLELKNPSNSRDSSVCKELLLFLPAKYLLAGNLLLVHPALKSLTGAVRGQPRSFCSLAPLIGPL